MSLTSYHVEDHVALIQLDRPRQMNAISTEMLGELLMHVAVARDDENVHVVVFSSTDYSCFSAGADIKEELDEEGRVTRMQQFADLYDAVLGAEVAERLGYRIGDPLVIAHGAGDVSFARHDDKPFRV